MSEKVEDIGNRLLAEVGLVSYWTICECEVDFENKEAIELARGADCPEGFELGRVGVATNPKPSTDEEFDNIDLAVMWILKETKSPKEGISFVAEEGMKLVLSIGSRIFVIEMKTRRIDALPTPTDTVH